MRAAVYRARERSFEKVCNARSRLLACVAVFVGSDDEHNRKLVKKAWTGYVAAQNEYHDWGRGT